MENALNRNTLPAQQYEHPPDLLRIIGGVDIRLFCPGGRREGFDRAKPKEVWWEGTDTEGWAV
jgi:hypothetical protein